MDQSLSEQSHSVKQVCTLHTMCLVGKKTNGLVSKRTDGFVVYSTLTIEDN